MKAALLSERLKPSLNRHIEDLTNLGRVFNNMGLSLRSPTYTRFLPLIEEEGCDVAIIDLNSPKHAAPIMAILRLKSKWPDLPVITLGGPQTDAALVDRAQAAGADIHLTARFADASDHQMIADCAFETAHTGQPAAIVAGIRTRTMQAGGKTLWHEDEQLILARAYPE